MSALPQRRAIQDLIGEAVLGAVGAGLRLAGLQ